MTYQIYHNPRCSKSRQTLALLEENGVTPEVELYLENGVTKEALTKILELLNVKPIEICRTGEAIFKELGLSKKDDDNVIFNAITENPKLLERPIVIKDGSAAVVGRPPENVKELL